MVFGQPDKWHKQKFKTVFWKLCLRSIRSLFCFHVMLMMLTGKIKVRCFMDFRGSSDFSGGGSQMCSRRKDLFLPLTPKQMQLKTQLRNTSSNNIIQQGCQDKRLKRVFLKFFAKLLSQSCKWICMGISLMQDSVLCHFVLFVFSYHEKKVK